MSELLKVYTRQVSSASSATVSEFRFELLTPRYALKNIPMKTAGAPAFDGYDRTKFFRRVPRARYVVFSDDKGRSE